MDHRWRYSLLFVLPPHHSHRTLSKSLPNKPTASLTPVAVKPGVNPLPKSLQAQSHCHNISNPTTMPRTDFETLRHSLSTQGTYSAKEFFRPPAQLAGSLSMPRLGQKAHSTLPILDIAVTHCLHMKYYLSCAFKFPATGGMVRGSQCLLTENSCGIKHGPRMYRLESTQPRKHQNAHVGQTAATWKQYTPLVIPLVMTL